MSVDPPLGNGYCMRAVVLRSQRGEMLHNSMQRTAQRAAADAER